MDKKVAIFLLISISLLILSGCVQEKCGDGKCGRGETAENCPADCAIEECGNGKCEAGETAESCPQDCGPASIPRTRAMDETTFSKYYFGAEGFNGTVPILRDLAVALEELGVGIVGINMVNWDMIEKSPGNYDWGFLDSHIGILQQHGFRAQLNVNSISSWATIKPNPASDLHYAPPREQYWDEWGQFIYELVERYDADGFKDMPGLRYAAIEIININGEIEFPTHWINNGGTAESYNKLLRLAQQNAHKADSSVVIARAGTAFGGLFDDNPSEEEIQERADAIPFGRQFLNFVESSLQQPDFDVFSIHYNGYYSGARPTVEYLEERMQSYGYTKPIMADDTQSNLANYLFNDMPPFYEDADNNGKPDIMETLDDPNNAGYEDARERFYRDQASLTVKKLAAGSEAGLAYILVSALYDWPEYPSIEWRHAGLIDTLEYQKTGSVEAAKKPVFYSYKLFLEKVLGANKNLERIDLGSSDLHIYKYTFPDKQPVFVAWKEGQGATISLSSQLGKDAATITKIITEIGVKEPSVEQVEADFISLDAMPVFIE